MSSRQEEKEQRKRERVERERAAQAAARRRRLARIAGGTALAAAVVVGVVVLAAAGGGADRVDDGAVEAAASTAGCVYRTLPSEGNTHVPDARTAADYKTNPPTSGDHSPEPAPDGLYVAGNEPAIANWVHTLEHGRVILQYKPGAAQETISVLQRLYDEPVLDREQRDHLLLMRNNTRMPYETAAVAWRHYVGCKDARPAALAAIRTFRDAFVDKGPELIP